MMSTSEHDNWLVVFIAMVLRTNWCNTIHFGVSPPDGPTKVIIRFKRLFRYSVYNTYLYPHAYGKILHLLTITLSTPTTQ